MTTKMWLCTDHSFVIVGTRDKISSRGSPGNREPGCAECAAAVDGAFAHLGLQPPGEPPPLDDDAPTLLIP